MLTDAHPHVFGVRSPAVHRSRLLLNTDNQPACNHGRSTTVSCSDTILVTLASTVVQRGRIGVSHCVSLSLCLPHRLSRCASHVSGGEGLTRGRVASLSHRRRHWRGGSSRGDSSPSPPWARRTTSRRRCCSRRATGWSATGATGLRTPPAHRTVSDNIT